MPGFRRQNSDGRMGRVDLIAPERLHQDRDNPGIIKELQGMDRGNTDTPILIIQEIQARIPGNHLPRLARSTRVSGVS